MKRKDIIREKRITINFFVDQQLSYTERLIIITVGAKRKGQPYRLEVRVSSASTSAKQQLIIKSDSREQRDKAEVFSLTLFDTKDMSSFINVGR